MYAVVLGEPLSFDVTERQVLEQTICIIAAHSAQMLLVWAGVDVSKLSRL